MKLWPFLSLLFLLLTPLHGYAATGLPMETFSKIPILHEGRIKPLESFAAAELDKLSGKSAKRSAAGWLAETLFNPQYAATRPVLKMANADLRARFNLPERINSLYSLAELSPHLAKTQEQVFAFVAQGSIDHLTVEQKALVRLHENALAYGQLLHAMSAYLPLQVTIPGFLDIDENPQDSLPTYQDIRKNEQDLIDKVRTLMEEKGENIDLYTPEEKAAAALAFELDMLRQAGARNVFLRIIPPQWEGRDEWLSPWALLESGQGSPQSAALIKAWQNMAGAWRTGDAKGWQAATQQAYDLALAQSADSTLSRRLSAEIFYNALNPFRLAFLLYALSLLGAAAFLWRQSPRLHRAAAALAGLGVAAQLSGVILRVFILERPPVGSLYESLLFVSLIVMVAALFLEYRRRDAFALLGGGAASLLILFIAPAIAPKGDDLQMLVAVLNTNFWLATHVICITAGYGISILASVLAHIYLFRRFRTPRHPQDGLLRHIYITSLAALLLTAIGTILGGIWADQSWGRFWGWDPKENGALLIVLWLIWAHHGRLGGHLSLRAFNAAIAFLNVIVALAWFGVNLLSVGLHSYGFISGVATGLMTFCAAETILIGTLWFRARHNTMKRQNI